MAGLQVKSFDSPDETRPFADKGNAKVINIGEGTVLYGTFEPGWHWADHVKPLAGTESCQSPHFLYVLSGRMAVRMDDGAEGEVGPNTVARIEPGHDAWVVGDEACVVVDFGPSPAYAKPRNKPSGRPPRGAADSSRAPVGIRSAPDGPTRRARWARPRSRA